MTRPLLLLAAVSAAVGAASPAPVPVYRVERSIPGPDGGWDYARVDVDAHRLYVARGTSVTVVDTERSETIGSVGSFAHGHAVVPVSGGRLLVTSGDDATVRFLAARDGRELARVAVGRKPDAAVLSADGRTAYVMNADDGTVSVIDLAAMTVSRTVSVKRALEYAAVVPGGTLFVNDEDANEIEVVDLERGRSLEPVALPGCEGPTGLAYDARTGRLIAACANGKAAIVDARRRGLVALVDIGEGADAVILDAERRVALVPCGRDGVLDVLSLDGPAIRRIGRVHTAVGARTGALDPSTGRIYLPTADLSPPRTEGGRGVPVPGTFRVIVVRPA